MVRTKINFRTPLYFLQAVMLLMVLHISTPSFAFESVVIESAVLNGGGSTSGYIYPLITTCPSIGSTPLGVTVTKKTFKVWFRFEDQLKQMPTYRYYKVKYSLGNNICPSAFSAVTTNQSLVIDVQTYGSYTDRSVNYYDVTTTAVGNRLRVDSVFVSTNGTTWTYSTNAATDLNGDFKLSTELLYDYYRNVSALTPPTPSHSSNTITTCSSGGSKTSDNYLTINWTNSITAESFDLEWLFVDDSTFSTTAVDWRNATRVNVVGTSYKIPLGFPAGIIAYRIRGIGKHPDNVTGGTGQLINDYSPWSHTSNATLPASQTFYYCGLEPRMNWDYSAAYAENALTAENLNFYDGLLNNRQSVGFGKTDNTVAISETVYDYLGRPALSILPGYKSNTTTDGLKYYGSGVSNAYTKANFDLDSKITTGPDALTSGIAANFYSASNPFYGVSGYEANSLIPNSEGYPFSQVRYMNDGSGRILAVGGVGDDYQIKSGGHTTRFYYGSPEGQKQLDRMFGNEVGFVDHYTKNMVVDENGQVYISYVDQHGRTIATALAGPPENTPALLGIPSADENYVTGTTLSDDFLYSNNHMDQNGTSVVSEKVILVSQAGSVYNFTYQLNGMDFCDNCLLADMGKECYSCKYKLNVQVINLETNAAITPAITNPSGGTFPILLSSTTTPHVTFSVTFPDIGSYKVIKTLELEETDFNTTLNNLGSLLIDAKNNYRDAYRDFHLNGVGSDPGTFTSGCIEYEINPQPCYTCEELCDQAYRYKLLDANGDPVTYSSACAGLGITAGSPVYVYYGAPGTSGPNGTNLWIPNCTSFPGYSSYTNLNIITGGSGPDLTTVMQQITDCQAQCDVPQVTLTECDLKLKLLKNDMSPGGQYFDNLPWKFSSDGFTVASNYESTLRNAYLNTLSVTPSGICGSCSTWNDVRNNWIPAYADVLVQYHPEYCAYTYYCENSFIPGPCSTAGMPHSSQEFDELMNSVYTDADALAQGLFDPLDVSTNPDISAYNNALTCGYDPTLLSIPGANTVMYNYLLNFIPCSTCTSGGNISIWELISDPNNIRLQPLGSATPAYPDEVIELFQAMHGTTLAGSCGLFINPSIPCTTGITQISRFSFFRSAYMAKKREIMQANFDNWAATNCNSAHSIYNYQTCTPVCSTAALTPCSNAFLSCRDINGDMVTDPSSYSPLNNVGNYSIHYPYIDFNITGNQGNNTCTNLSIATSNRWINQLDQEFINCTNTPIPSATQSILRGYLREIAKAFCLKGVDVDNASAQYPGSATAYTIPNLGWGTFTINPGDMLVNVLNSNTSGIIALFESNTSNSACPDIMIPMAYPGITPSDPPITTNAPCACDRLGEFIQGNATLLVGASVPYNPFDLTYSGITPTGFADYDVSGILTAFNTYINNPTYTYTTADLLELADHCHSNKTLVTTPATNKWTVYMSKFNCEPLTLTPDPLTCEEQNIIIAIENADNQFNQDLANLLDGLRTNYRTRCFENIVNREKMTATYTLTEYHYTLYYYDQAGNIIKTVPPQGVTLISDQVELGEIGRFRERNHGRVSNIAGQDYTDYSDNGGAYTNGGATQKFTWPNHTRITNYRYNSLNQLTEQFTPDGQYNGTGGYAGLPMTRTLYYYDALGRLVLSQNARQKDDGKYSYTLFDRLGRMNEVGEINFTISPPSITQAFTSQPGSSPASLTPLEIAIKTNKANKKEVTKTFYDAQQSFATLITQANLRGRVASVAIYSVMPADSQYYDNAIHYSYDMHGNVNQVVNDFPFLNPFGKRFLTTSYTYDLISGNTKEVEYQETYQEEFHHKYTYDKDNRLSKVSSYVHPLINFTENKDALYNYYIHGPLQRVELGDRQVQGIDYAYTLQGWLKGMNSSELENTYDMGRDSYKQISGGSAYAPHANFAADAAAFTLYYNQGDYAPVNTSYGSFAANIWGLDYGNAVLPSSTHMGLYNGNITAMTTAIRKSHDKINNPNVLPLPVHGMAFQYDQLNRLRVGKSFIKTAVSFYSTSALSWSTTTAGKYDNGYTYNMDGDLKSLYRYGVVGTTTTLMDNFTYNYVSGKHELAYVGDGAISASFTDDIDNQTNGNYTYDNLGNLTADVQAGVSAIKWNLYGKVKEVTKSTAPSLKFYYNPMGQRVVKEIAGTTTSDYEIYSYDAGGNVMAIYSLKYVSNKYEMRLAEVPIYGSDRLGEYKPNVLLTNCATCATVTGITNVANSTVQTNVNGGNYKTPLTFTYTTGTLSRKLGIKEYEIKNHLGNVLVTVSDRKLAFRIPGNSTTSIDYYLPMVMTHSDYYPYGMPINSEGRTGIAVSGTNYRFGFGGQEKDNEVAGNGNSYTADYWQYDPRLGRRWNVDPMKANYAGQSPYACFNDNPIYFIDPRGLEGEEPGGGDDNKGDTYKDSEASGGYGYELKSTRTYSTTLTTEQSWTNKQLAVIEFKRNQRRIDEQNFREDLKRNIDYMQKIGDDEGVWRGRMKLWFGDRNITKTEEITVAGGEIVARTITDFHPAVNAYDVLNGWFGDGTNIYGEKQSNLEKGISTFGIIPFVKIAKVVKYTKVLRFIATSDNVIHDLKPTLDRITNGGKFPHRNDGSIFKNREGLLPNKNPGYYTEYVHPTPGTKGPGAMRIVVGQDGDMWFTPDHYKTFIPITQ